MLTILKGKICFSYNALEVVVKNSVLLSSSVTEKHREIFFKDRSPKSRYFNDTSYVSKSYYENHEQKDLFLDIHL